MLPDFRLEATSPTRWLVTWDSGREYDRHQTIPSRIVGLEQNAPRPPPFRSRHPQPHPPPKCARRAQRPPVPETHGRGRHQPTRSNNARFEVTLGRQLVGVLGEHAHELIATLPGGGQGLNISIPESCRTSGAVSRGSVGNPEL